MVAFKILIVPVILYINWDLITPFVDPSLQSRNPFAPLFLLSHRVPASSEEDPRYQKGYLDLLFIAYYIVFWSCIRQIITVNICKRICHYFGIKKQVKIERFGEQGYAFVYFAFFGAWGFVSRRTKYLPLVTNIQLTEDNVPTPFVLVPYGVFLAQYVIPRNLGVSLTLVQITLIGT